MSDAETERPAAADKLDMGLKADAEVRHVQAQLPTREETIRTNALSLAISAQPRLLDSDRDSVIETAARFEAWIRGVPTDPSQPEGTPA